MKIQTRCFGEIELTEDKIINFSEGLLGFEEYKRYTLIHDIKENGEKSKISWLQCVDEEGLALPVMNPFDVVDEYDPALSAQMLKKIGDVTAENGIILLTVTVPQDVTLTTVNMRAPIIINSDTRQGIQIIVENKNYLVKYPIMNQKSKGESEC